MANIEFSSLEELFEVREKEILDACIQCGECISACPIFSVSALKDRDTAEIAEKMFAVLEEKKYSDEAYQKSFSCMLCGNCIDVCPQGLNPMFFNHLVRARLVEQGNEIPDALGLLLPNREPYLPRILSGIQMKPSEARWVDEVPSDPEKRDVVVFLGCSALATPDKNFALIDILERMNVDFTALIGGKICCGVCNMFAGQLKEADSMSKNLVESVSAFSPERLIVACPACYDQLKNVISQYTSFDFEVQLVSAFLNDNMDNLNFNTPLDKKVTLHDACPLSRGIKDDASIRNIINALPGVEMVEMEHNREESLCCGSLAGFTYPEYAGRFTMALMEEGKASGADAMVNVCNFCHLTLSSLSNKYDFELTDLVTLVNLAQGGDKYEDKIRTYWRYGDLDQILKDANECINASGLDINVLKQLLPIVFQLA